MRRTALVLALAVLWPAALAQGGLEVGPARVLGLGALNDLDYSPASGLVAAASGRGLVLWDANLKWPTRTLSPGVAVGVAALTRDGKRLATVENGAVRVWDPSAGKALATYKVAALDRVDGLVWSPDGKRLYAQVAECSDEHPFCSGTVRSWLSAGGKALRTNLSLHPVGLPVPSPDGRLLAVPQDYGTAMVDAVSLKEVGFVDGEGATPAFSPDSARLAVAGNDEVKVLDSRTRRVLVELKTEVGAAVTWSPDGRRLAVRAGGTVRVLDGRTLKGLSTLRPPASGEEVEGLDFSANGRTLAVTLSSETTGWRVRLWDPTTGKLARTLEGGSGVLGFSPDGKRLVTSFSEKGQAGARVWDVTSGRVLGTLSGFTGPVRSVAFGPDGKRLVAGGNGSSLVWDVAGGKVLEAAQSRWREVDSVALDAAGRVLTAGYSVLLSPTGARVASTDDRAAGDTVVVEDAVSGNEVARLTGFQGALKAFAFSPDGRQLAIGTQSRNLGTPNELRLWDLATGRPLPVTFPPAPGSNGGTYSIAWRPDGGRLAVDYGNETRLLDTGSGALALTIHEQGPSLFSPDGKWLLVGGTLFDASGGKKLVSYTTGTNYPRGWVFSPDGSLLVRPTEDNTVQVFNSATGKRLALLEGHAGKVTGLAFSPGGSLLASGSLDGTVRLWPLRRRP